MTNVALVTRKLSVLEEHLARMRSRRPTEAETFLVDTLLQDALAMSVLVVVQEAIDIALHVASDEGWGVATRYAEGFDLLAKHGVIPASLATELGRAVQLRNRIAHGYASIDAARLFGELPDGERAFSAFSRAVAAYVATRV